MPTYNPTIVISAAPGITGYLRLSLAEARPPSVEVAASAQLAPPHTVSRQIQILGLRGVIHLVTLYVTDGVSPTGTIIANFEIDPRFPGVELKASMFIYAGQTPGFDVGSNTFLDPDGELEGWDYEVDIRGFGKLDDGEDSGNIEIDKTPPGYVVTIPDYQLQPDELHIISFAPKAITYTASDSASDLFTSVEIITADRSLVAADAGKAFFIQSATSTVTVTMPEIDSVSAGKVFMLTSQGGNHKNAVIAVDGSDSEKIDWLFGENIQIVLGQSEFAWIFKWVDPDDSANRRWKVLQASTGLNMVGELVYDFKYQAADLLNCIQCAGQEVDRDIYPRLWAWVQGLDASILVSDATWNTGETNKSRFSTGDGSTTFRLPLLHTPGFLRGVDGSIRKAGDIEAQSTEDTYTKFDPGTSQDFYMNKITVASYAANWYARDSQGDTSGADSSNRTTGLAHGSLGTGTTKPANTGAYLLIRI